MGRPKVGASVQCTALSSSTHKLRHAILLAMSQTYFLRLQPPRATFAHDLNAEERQLMQQHAAYARSFFERGKLLVYGPVFDPEGSFGIAVLLTEEEAELHDFIANDPTVLAGLNRYTYAPMLLGGSQPPPSPNN